MSTPKVINAIVCDDVRVENNNKNILIGVYPDDIVVTAAPATLRVTLWIQVDDVDRKQSGFEFRGLLEKKKLFEGGFEVAPPQQGARGTIILGGFPLKIEREGYFKFDLRFRGGGRWKNAITMPVRIQKTSSA